MATYTWNGGSASAEDPNQWTLNGTTPAGPPTSGDSAIVPSGTVLGGNNTQLNDNTLYIGSAAFIVGGDTSVTFQMPTFDGQTVLTSAVPGASGAEHSLLVATDRFVNQGTIDAAGPAGSTFTIQVTTDGTLPGTFINYNQISVESGNEMVIDIAGTSELANVGVIQVNGGTLVINAATNAIAGGFAPFAGIDIIDGGGTLETNASYGTSVAGAPQTYAFADQTAGNTLKIDNVTSFGGAIIGFGVNDTIDVGTSLAVGKLAYNASSGILNLENAGGTILASLLLRGGDFQTGTAALSGGSALSFNIGTSAVDGDTIITTGSLNDLSLNTSGTWQTAGIWSNGVPGTLDSTFIGNNAHSDFTITTGTSPVQVGPLYVVDHHATLQVTSNTTINSNTLTEFGGTTEVMGGNTLTSQGIRQTGGSITIDPNAVFNLTGSPPFNFIPSNGTLTVTSSNTLAARIAGGSVLVNGTLNAAPITGGGGGRIDIGMDGGGTPATVTVQNSGTSAAVVADTYTELGSDPTSFGILTLSSSATWTDEIDSHDTSTNSGVMFLGTDNVAGNIPAGVAKPPFTNAATLLAENGALLIDQRSAQIGSSFDSAGAATIETGALWQIGTVGKGGLTVGSTGDGSASILNGGTIELAGTSGISIGNSAGAIGTIAISGTNPSGGANSLLQFDPSSKGITVGNGGQGTIAVSSGGTIALNGTGGLQLAGLASGTGTVTVDGPNALIAMGTSAGGVSVGFAGTGLLDIETGGTFLMDGTAGIAVGLSAGSSGLIIVNGGVINEGTTSTGLFVGQSGSGTLNVSSAGTVTIANGPLLIGNVGSGGTVSVVGAGSEIATLGTSGINVGNGGGGMLLINGGTVAAATFISVASGGASLGSGNVQMIGGTLSAAGFSIGGSGQGTLSIGSGGIVTAGTSGFNIGFSPSSGGSVTLNNGTLTETAGFFGVGNTNASGTLFVGNNGSLHTGGASFVSDINATGTGLAAATISGGHWTVGGQLIVGDTGNGTLNINNSGVVNAGVNFVDIGNQAGANGNVFVSNGTLVGGSLSIATNLTGVANGTLTVGASGSAQFTSITEGGGGNISVTGGSLTSTGGVVIGFGNAGAILNVNSLGLVSETGTAVPFDIGSGTTGAASGTVNVFTGGSLSSASQMLLGANIAGSSGTLNVNGGIVSEMSSLSLGGANGTSGTVTVGSGTLTTTGNLAVGGMGSGLLVVDSAGTVNANGGVVVDPLGGGNGTLVVNGGSLNATTLTIGNGATATATIEAGGTLTAFNNSSPFTIGNGLGGSASVTVDAATFSTSGEPLFVGNGGNGSLTVQDGGKAITVLSGPGGAVADINASAGKQASVTVTGPASLWQIGASIINNLIVGDSGNGLLDIALGGTFSGAGFAVDIGNQSGGSGTIIVGSGLFANIGGQMTVAASGATGTLVVGSGGTVNISTLNIGSGGLVSMTGGTLSANGFGGSTNNGLISGAGTLITNLTNSGSVNAIGGRLIVAGTVNGTGVDSIGSASTLEVGGTINPTQSVGFTGASASLQLDALSGTIENFVLTGWQNTDELIFGNGSIVTGAHWLNNGSETGTLEVDTNGGTIDFIAVTLASATNPTFNTGSNFVELVSCFAAGTRIATLDEEVAVEALQVGDSVMLANGELEHVIWIGHRTIDCMRHPRPEQVWPVRIAAGAFGSLPHRDLFLSPDHAVLIDDVLVPVKHLIDGGAIAQVQVDSVTYYHVELTHHAVLLAEGLPAESYLDVGDRSHFANGGAVVTLHPDLACRVWEAAACAPLVVAGPQLDAAKRRLRAA